MNKWICFCILFLSVLSFGQLSVEVKDEQVYNSSMLGLRVRIINNSGQSYDNVTADIYLKKNPSETFVLDNYYTENWSLSISEQSGENVVVHVTIPHVGAGYSPNESGVSVGIHRSDWQSIAKSSTNGFPSGAAFTEALDYSMFQGNNMIGGTAYIDPSLVTPSLRFVGLQPVDNGDGSIPAWIEIENYGTTPADLNDMTLEWPLGAGIVSKVVSSAVLQPGEKLRICAVQQDCPNDDVVASESSLPVGPSGTSGEVLLRYNGTAMDYLSWGQNAAVLAADARAANIQYTRFRCEGGFYDEYWHQVRNGIFFKKIGEKWYSYNTDEYDVNTTDRPEPISYINDETLCLEGSAQNRMVRFAWHPVEGAIGYNLSVRKSDGTVLFNQFTNYVHHDMNLGEGTYEWSVRVVFFDDKYVVDNPWIDHYAVWKTKNVVSCSDITDEHELQVPHYGVHKDTRMLVPNWGELAEYPEISWDHPDVFVYNSGLDPWTYMSGPPNNLFLEVSTRCWAVATQILNAYYGGNLTQDEIKFYGKTVGFDNVKTVFGTYSRPKRDTIIGPFALGEAGAGYPVEVYETLKWALNIDDSQLEYGKLNDVFEQNFVIEHINKGRPIYYSNGPHAMVIDGYRFSLGELQLHVINLYNGGESDWIYNQRLYVDCYFVPKNVTNPLNTNILVHIDSDKDGIVDFDEIYRFGTDRFSKDSDGDGIEDKVEIFSYTIREPFVKTMQYTDSHGFTSTVNLHLGDYPDDVVGTIYRTEVFADIDGDGLRAEKDFDSDHPNNDGLNDGLEDLNHNGYVDNGETDPYNITDDYGANFNPVETTEWNIPGLIGIYAFEGINIGDNVNCYSGMHGYCQVASESALQYYAVSLGANSSIGNVFSKGGVQLRSNAHVVGDVGIYSVPTSPISSELSQGASVTGMEHSYNLGEWPYVVSDNNHHSLDGKENWSDLTVHAGQTFTLSGNAAYRNLKVDAGGTLKLGTGTIRVGNITMESGSKLEFVAPGRETVIIADGNVIWRAQIVNSDLQTVAKGFKLIEYAPCYIHIDGDWAGMIHARWSELTLGQVKKTAYGSFVAKKVYLGNGLTLYRVSFDPISLVDMV